MMAVRWMLVLSYTFKYSSLSMRLACAWNFLLQESQQFEN